MKAGATIALLLLLTMHAYQPAHAQTVSGVVNTYHQVSSINTAANSVTVDDASALTPGQRVLLIQAKGATIGSGNTSTFGDITAINDAGNYEFNTICSINGNVVVLKAVLLNSYDLAGYVQLVSIPSYGSVIVSGTISSIPWNPVTGKGGIVVMEATGTIFLNADIDVRGQGFQGGALVDNPTPPYDCSWAVAVADYYLSLPASGYYTGGKKGEGITNYILNKEYGQGKLANGGGGGNNTNSGGAGGGNYGAGGVGGKKAGETTFFCHGMYPGIGGLSLAPYGYSTAANKIFFGGGGGSGQENNARGMPGGNGGGIIILSAGVIAGGGGQLLASGVIPMVMTPGYADPIQAEGDGGGGGGAGGTVILNTPTVTGTVIVEAKGAKGSDAGNTRPECTGPGGGGGGGVIWTAGGAFPAAVSPSVGGGANGIVSLGNTLLSCQGLSNGALPGNAGIGKFGYTAPESILNTCVPLAASPLKYFTGRSADQSFLLAWGLITREDAGEIRSFTIERSSDQVHFISLATIGGSTDSMNYRYTDIDKIPGTVFYRLVWMDKMGLRSYSRIITATRPLDPAIEWIRLQPNPASDQISVKLFSYKEETASLLLFTAQGRELASYPVMLHTGTASIILPVKDLPMATYFLVVVTKERRQIKSFIKK